MLFREIIRFILRMVYLTYTQNSGFLSIETVAICVVAITTVIQKFKERMNLNLKENDI